VLSPRGAAAILVAPFAVLALEWSTRELPEVPCGNPPDPAWTSGVSAAAFITGCVCLTVAVRIRPHLPTVAAAGAWVVAALTWWVEGESSPLSLWAGIAYLLLVPVVPMVLVTLVAIALRPSWTPVSLLAWVGAIVLVPGFLGVIDMAGSDFKC
jgi:hypothetical protein